MSARRTFDLIPSQIINVPYRYTVPDKTKTFRNKKKSRCIIHLYLVSLHCVQKQFSLRIYTVDTRNIGHHVVAQIWEGKYLREQMRFCVYIYIYITLSVGYCSRTNTQIHVYNNNNQTVMAIFFSSVFRFSFLNLYFFLFYCNGQLHP